LGWTGYYLNDSLVKEVKYVDNRALDWILPKCEEVYEKKHQHKIKFVERKVLGDKKIRYELGERLNGQLYGRGIQFRDNGFMQIQYWEKGFAVPAKFI